MNTLAVVVSFNDVDNTLKTVHSLKHQARVVVWDNGSSDGTVDALQAFPEVEVHACPDNILWTPALNQAVETYLKQEKYILFSNNDIVYRPNVVERLEDAFTDPQVAITGPTGSGMGGPQDYAHHWGKGHGHHHPKDLDPLPTQRVTYLVGASMMVSRTAWETLGELDNNMPLGADDHDYCIRAKENDFSIKVVYSAYISHKSHSSHKHTPDTWEKYGGPSWDVFNAKWAGYYHDKEEAVKCHWGGVYHEGWEKGTGRLSPEERQKVWDLRSS